MKTKHEIKYHSPHGGKIATIPKGTPVKLAGNMPFISFWCEPWEGMTDEQESWQRNYGFLIDPDEVEE